jgi:hypothetical protein
MASFLCWDSTRASSPKIETGSYPVLAAASRHASFEEKFPTPTHSRGKFEMMARLGQVLEATTCIRFFIMDGAGAHEWCHRALLGQVLPLSEDLMDCLPFWKSLSFQDLPISDYALGYRVVLSARNPLATFPELLTWPKTLLSNAVPLSGPLCSASSRWTALQAYSWACGLRHT